jgi:uncharacterized membrane protein
MSARVLRITLVMLATAGLGIAGYLTYVHYAGIDPVCTAGGSCEKVQTSVYSELAGVPVALIGLLGYISILGLLVGPETEVTRFAMMALTLVGFAFSAYLTYRELYSIHVVCEWCASSAVILTVMAPLSVWRFLRVTPNPSARAGSSPAQESGGHESTVRHESTVPLGSAS